MAIKINYITVGTGRCGTVFMARLLTSIGIPCGHEGIFTNKGVEEASRIIAGLSRFRLSHVSRFDIKARRSIKRWLSGEVVAESSYMAAPYLSHPLLSDASIIHIVRHPLKVITSFVKDFRYFKVRRPNNKYLTFIYSHLPDLAEFSHPLEAAAYYYVNWNKLIADKAKESGNRYYFTKIESVPSQEFFDFLGQNPDTYFSNTKINSASKDEKYFSINEIPDGNVKASLVEIMDEYGYEIF